MPLMSVKQLADELGVSPRTIYDWKYKGIIPYIKLGKLLRFDPEAIEKWIKSKNRELVRERV